MKRDHIKELLKEKVEREVLIYGWVRTNRAQAQFGFLNVNDGSTLTNIQVVYDNKIENFSEISKFRTGVSLEIHGYVVLTPNNKQPLEIHATSVK